VGSGRLLRGCEIHLPTMLMASGRRCVFLFWVAAGASPTPRSVWRCCGHTIVALALDHGVAVIA